MRQPVPDKMKDMSRDEHVALMKKIGAMLKDANLQTVKVRLVREVACPLNKDKGSWNSAGLQMK